MTARRGWRAFLAAATPIVLAGLGVIVSVRGPDGAPPPRARAGGPANQPGYASSPASRAHPPAGLADWRIAGPGVAASGDPGRHRVHRAAGPAATGGQGSRPGPFPGARSAVAEIPAPSMARSMWRSLLESRWQQRLDAVIRLSVAYHDVAGRSGTGRLDEQAEPRQLRQLMQKAIAARRALADTEDALTRLSAGTYGRCEQCGTALPVARLLLEPESRYCERCAQQIPGFPHGDNEQLRRLPGLG